MPASKAPAAPPCRIDLALQGGGSHGAFTWGVLDRLLEVETIEFAGISGTSAGAMNAVSLAAGLMDGGREGARRALRTFWQKVAEMSPFHHLQPTHGWAMPWMQPWLAPMQQFAMAIGGQLSPYQFNPLNLNPLRDALNDTVDFERVRNCNKSRLYIAATQVRTGALRIFHQEELNADVVMASACLPLLFQAVEIDGEAYWDGGYAGNPSLMPLLEDGSADDLLVVQINPQQRAETPVSSRDILDRINEVTFNASLMKELRSIALLRQLIEDELEHGRLCRQPMIRRVQALRLHLLEGGAALADFGARSKSNTEWSFLLKLHGLGRDAASQWLERHGDDIGKRGSFDFASVLPASAPVAA